MQVSRSQRRVRKTDPIQPPPGRVAAPNYYGEGEMVGVAVALSWRDGGGVVPPRQVHDDLRSGGGRRHHGWMILLLLLLLQLILPRPFPAPGVVLP
jgi:hypothetical protein